jgi:hypothetical protein
LLLGSDTVDFIYTGTSMTTIIEFASAPPPPPTPDS